MGAHAVSRIYDPSVEENVGEGELTAYYDSRRREYLVRDKLGGWLPLNETQYKRRLRRDGLRSKAEDGELISEVDARLLEVQEEFNIDYAGPVAGYDSGFYTEGETRFLVTRSPNVPKPEPGDWSTIKALINGLLRDDTGQINHLYGWLKIACEALRERKFRPGQAVAFAGPRESGKSLLQNHIITPALGGRVAKPYQHMVGDTPFNSDLFAAEHLSIEDEHASTDIRARLKFGAQIKNITVNDIQRCHQKNREAFTMRPFWRLSISLNDEPEHMMVLPPMDESIEDKIMLFKVSKKPMPMPTRTLEERQAFLDRIAKELPAFLHWLTEWEIPEDIRCQRFGVRYFHHPELLEEINDLSPEERFMGFIDLVLFDNGASMNGSWTGKAIELQHELTDQDSPVQREAQKLLGWNCACGSYLGRLAKRKEYKDRIKSDGQKGKSRNRLWTIHPPRGGVNTMNTLFPTER